jgi:hypothetical protein
VLSAPLRVFAASDVDALIKPIFLAMRLLYKRFISA